MADAVDAALEGLAENVDNTHYLVGSVVGPDPFPRMVRDFQSVIGEEAREHAMFRETGRYQYVGVTDDWALAAFRTLSETEGIIPALEISHVLALAEDLADEHDLVVVNLGGRGDKDMHQAAEYFDLG